MLNVCKLKSFVKAIRNYGSAKKPMMMGYMKKYGLSIFSLILALLCVASFEALADGKIHIIEAKYGVKGIYSDVTHLVKNYILDDSIRMQVTNNNLGGDPASGKLKQLRVLYEKNGRKYSRDIVEQGWFVVTGTSDEYAPSYHTGEIEILKAIYGTDEGAYRIVTGDVQSFVRRDAIRMRVTNENLDGDPAPGKGKKLMVVCKIDGREHTLTFNEGDWFVVSGSIDALKSRYRPGGKLEILKATYTRGGANKIVTDHVKRFVRKESIRMQVNDDNLGGDPTIEKDQKLTVIYKKDGQQHTAVILKGDWFIVAE